MGSAVLEATASTFVGEYPYLKLRRLKDRMWVRKALEDLKAAEFASSLSVAVYVEDDKEMVANGPIGNDRSSNRRKRTNSSKFTVDFDNVLKNGRYPNMIVHIMKNGQGLRPIEWWFFFLSRCLILALLVGPCTSRTI